MPNSNTANRLESRLSVANEDKPSKTFGSK